MANARDELRRWASHHNLPDPEEWWGVQPFNIGNGRAGGMQIWTDKRLYWVDMTHGEYQEALDLMRRATGNV